MKATLVIMAAGMGSRYGGEKQTDGIGPHGEAIMEYSVYDAVRAGFHKIVFIIKPGMEPTIRALCGDRIETMHTPQGEPVEVAYAVQAFSSIPAFYTIPPERKKPFGTVHALLCAEPEVDGPFCIINADEYYGVSAYGTILQKLLTLKPTGEGAMVGYRLKNTVSDNGTVSRGVCQLDSGSLRKVKETLKIKKYPDGRITDTENPAQEVPLDPESVVSMNFWGFSPAIFDGMEQYFHVSYVYQDLDRLPEGIEAPEGRTKPWGTGHALACCKGVVNGPFAVINADDFYGRTAFSEIYDFLAAQTDESKYAMVGYRLKNTVTEFGSVARGVCEVQNGMLMGITERTKIYQRGDHAAYTEDGEHFVDLPGDTIVSMNIWGFTQPTVSEFWTRLGAFFEKEVPLDPLKREFYLPSVVNQQLEEGTARVRVLPCEEVWHGVTYREDLASVKEAICALKAAGVYEERLWPD